MCSRAAHNELPTSRVSAMQANLLPSPLYPLPPSFRPHRTKPIVIRRTRIRTKSPWIVSQKFFLTRIHPFACVLGAGMIFVSKYIYIYIYPPLLSFSSLGCQLRVSKLRGEREEDRVLVGYAVNNDVSEQLTIEDEEKDANWENNDTASNVI